MFEENCIPISNAEINIILVVGEVLPAISLGEKVYANLVKSFYSWYIAFYNMTVIFLHSTN